MTDLDDALNTNAPVLAPPLITADWLELKPGVSVGGVDSLRDLGQQMGPEGFEVEHSFDDGLPDAVTMTGTSDASGSFGMGLVGRPANEADVLTGWRASTGSGSGSGTSITVTLPTGLRVSDYLLVAITVNNQNGIWEFNSSAEDLSAWRMLAEVSDGVGPTLTTYLFGRAYYPSMPAPDFRLNVSGSWSWVSGALGAHYTANEASVVPVWPGGDGTTLFETVTGTSHTGPTGTLTARGYVVGVFATPNASGPWTLASGGTQLVQSTGGLAALQMVKTALIDTASVNKFVSNTAGSTGVAMMVALPLLVMDRPEMDAMSYFSEYDERSPIRTFERDTALMSADVNLVSPNGVVATRVFTGQMTAISVKGREADLEGLSATRLKLDKSFTLPTVWGDREACTTDWLAGYLMAQGGQYPGIAPSPYTRFWAPMHGSMHPFMSGNNSYAGGLVYEESRIPHGPFGLRPPQVVDGPFVKGMQGMITDARTEDLFITCNTNKWDTEVPGQETDMYDFCTQQNSIGRMSFWIRGDANDATPDSLAGTGAPDYLFQASVSTYYDALGNSNLIFCQINALRQPVIYLESGFTLTGGDVPADGLWHFVGFAWDYKNGLAKVRRDNSTWSLSGFTSTGFPLAVSEEAIYAAGRRVDFYLKSRLPIADFQVEAGPTMYSELFTRFYPAPTLPSQNATYRPTNKNLAAISEAVPVQGWATLQEVAEATASAMRVDESDNIALVPMEYFGETAQMTVNSYNVLDTSVQASDLDITTDPSKIRNVVTVSYQDTRTDTNRTSLMDIMNSTPIPGGKTTMVLPLELPAAELHGAGSPLGVVWNLTKLTASQVSGGTPVPNEHFMTVNKYEDGSAVTYTGTGVTARIQTWSSSTVTIEFTNTVGSTYYLANNGSGIPALRIIGYPVRRVEAYSEFRDSSSAAKRKERSMVIPATNWIQDAVSANELAGKLINATSGPRPTMSVTAMGDPRREPGQLCSIADSEGTRADGTWRILSVKHRQSGAMYLQDLIIVRVGPTGYWDVDVWDDGVWGE